MSTLQTTFLKHPDAAGNQITFTSGGNTGIGTASPGRRLSVQNSAVDTEGIALYRNTGDGTLMVGLAQDADGHGEIRVNNASGIRNVQIRGNGISYFNGGDVGVGTTAPTEIVEISKSSPDPYNTIQTHLKLNNGAGNAGSGNRITFATGATQALIQAKINGANSNSGSDLEFYTHSTTGTPTTPRLIIDTDGRLLVGTSTSVGSTALIQAVKSSGTVNIVAQSSSFANTDICSVQTSAGGRLGEIGIYKHSGITNAAAFLRLDEEDGTLTFLWVDNSGNLRIGSSVSLVGTTSGTVVGTQTSDARLKNIGSDVAYGLAEIKQLETKQYALKTDPNTNKLGFIAQQVESIIPEAVFDTSEELDGHQEGDRTKLGMDYAQLIPVLVNSIKELSAEVENLKAKVAALEAL